MNVRFALPALAVAFATAALAVPASAHPHDDAAFPMKAAEFQAKVDARAAKAREHVERRIADKKLDAEQAKALRARIEAAIGAVQAEAQKAEADGVVTKEEAHAVRKVFREARGHGRHARHAKDGAGRR